MEREGVDYVVVESLGYRQTDDYLVPAVQEYETDPDAVVRPGRSDLCAALPHTRPMRHPMPLKQQVHHLLAVSTDGDLRSRAVDLGILGLIFLNVVALTLETGGPGPCPEPGRLRLVRAHLPDHLHRRVRLRPVVVHGRTPGTRVPCWAGSGSPSRHGRHRPAGHPAPLPAALRPDMRFIRIVRLLRFFRLAKLFRYSRALRLLGRVVLGKREELASICIVLVTLLVIASSLMYFVEHDDQPDKFSSIPQTMWWG